MSIQDDILTFVGECGYDIPETLWYAISPEQSDELLREGAYLPYWTKARQGRIYSCKVVKHPTLRGPVAEIPLSWSYDAQCQFPRAVLADDTNTGLA